MTFLATPDCQWRPIHITTLQKSDEQRGYQNHGPITDAPAVVFPLKRPQSHENETTFHRRCQPQRQHRQRPSSIAYARTRDLNTRGCPRVRPAITAPAAQSRRHRSGARSRGPPDAPHSHSRYAALPAISGLDTPDLEAQLQHVADPDPYDTDCARFATG